jgi:hypothetical protein
LDSAQAEQEDKEEGAPERPSRPTMRDETTAVVLDPFTSGHGIPRFADPAIERQSRFGIPAPVPQRHPGTSNADAVSRIARFMENLDSRDD